MLIYPHVEHVSEEIKEFIGNKSIKGNISPFLKYKKAISNMWHAATFA